MTKTTPASSFLRGTPMIWTKTDEATASSASIVVTAMAIGKIKDHWNFFQYGFTLLSMLHTCIVALYAVVYFCWNRHKRHPETSKIQNDLAITKSIKHLAKIYFIQLVSPDVREFLMYKYIHFNNCYSVMQ